MPLPDFRLIRLLPLAALVLTACSVTTPKGLAKAGFATMASASARRAQS